MLLQTQPAPAQARGEVATAFEIRRLRKTCRMGEVEVCVLASGARVAPRSDETL